MSTSITIVDFKSVLPWLNISNGELISLIKNNYSEFKLVYNHQVDCTSSIVLSEINIFYIDYYTINIAKEILSALLIERECESTKFILYGFGVFYDVSFLDISSRFVIIEKENFAAISDYLDIYCSVERKCKSLLKADYSLLPIESIENYPIRTGRGCARSCPFCERSLDFSELKSIEEFENEIFYAKDRYNIKALTLWDSSLNYSIVRFKEVLKILRKVGLPWRSNGMLYQHMDSALIDEMYDSGCYLSSFGVESTDGTVKTGKPFNLDKYIRVNELLKIKGIINLSFFIIGLENDTYEKSINTIKFIEEIGVDISLFASAIAYPHTSLYNYVVKNKGRFLLDYRDFSLQSKNMIHFDTPDFSEEQRRKALSISEIFNKGNRTVKKQLEDRNGFAFSSSSKDNIKWK